MSAVLENHLQQLTPLGQRMVWVIAGLALADRSACRSHRDLDDAASRPSSTALRMTIEIKRWPLPPKWVNTGIAFVALLGVLASYRTLNGIDAGTSLLIAMAGMKLLETRSVRDLTVVVFLSYFALFAAFLYNQSMMALPYMLFTAGLLTMTLMRIHQTEAMPIREAAAHDGQNVSASIAAGGAAVPVLPSPPRTVLGRAGTRESAHRPERGNDAGRRVRIEPVQRHRVSGEIRRRATAAARALLARPRDAYVRWAHLAIRRLATPCRRKSPRRARRIVIAFPWSRRSATGSSRSTWSPAGTPAEPRARRISSSARARNRFPS